MNNNITYEPNKPNITYKPNNSVQASKTLFFLKKHYNAYIVLIYIQ